MPDLLTHVLLTYALATILSGRYRWISGGYVTVAMAGALVPDLNHVTSIVPSPMVSELLAIPFDWGGLQTGGVVCLLLIAIATLFEQSERRRVAALLAVGAVSHLLTDALIRTPDGRSQSLFWPVTRYQPPTPGLYTSTDLWPLILAACLAAVSWYVVRYREQNAYTPQRRYDE